MDDFLKAALLLNACRAPFSSWEALREREPELLWASGEAFWDILGLRPSSRTVLAELLSEKAWPERELQRVNAQNARFITSDNPDYPARLKDLPQPPIGLYIKGAPSVLNKASIAVVGTRKCSLYAKTVAESLGRAAAHSGLVVVSGGARGVDCAGHEGCLSEGGTTVAILGTSVDRVYPSEHRDLFEKIAVSGALVSEYPMATGGDPWHFPERNRLIVGMARRIVVVESPEDGGAMISARLALDLGREVWSVPGRITESVANGSNALIRDGANALVDISDFIEKISSCYGQLLLDFEDSPRLAPTLSTDEKIVLGLLQRQGGRTADELLAESGLDMASLQTALMTLTAARFVTSSGPGRYAAIP